MPYKTTVRQKAITWRPSPFSTGRKLMWLSRRSILAMICASRSLAGQKGHAATSGPVPDWLLIAEACGRFVDAVRPRTPTVSCQTHISRACRIPRPRLCRRTCRCWSARCCRRSCPSRCQRPCSLSSAASPAHQMAVCQLCISYASIDGNRRSKLRALGQSHHAGMLAPMLYKHSCCRPWPSPADRRPACMLPHACQSHMSGRG